MWRATRITAYLIVFVLSLTALAAAYDVNTHEAISLLAIKRHDCIVDRFLKDDLSGESYDPNAGTNVFYEVTPGLHYGGINANVRGIIDSRGYLNKTLTYWLAYGSMMEDGGTNDTRVKNHFYEPLENKGLTDDYWGEGTDSLRWGWNMSDWNWQVARTQYYDWLTKPTQLDRQYAAGKTFRALGHVIHLLQDAAQPQHTRNDAHINPSILYINPSHEASEFEAFCSTHYGTEGQISALGFVGLPTLPEPPNDGDIPPELKAFWDTEQYRGPALTGVPSATLGLAEYSSYYFVTDDTMFTGSDRVFLTAPPNPAVMTVKLKGRVDRDNNLLLFPRLEDTNLNGLAPGFRSLELAREGQGLVANPTTSQYNLTIGGETFLNHFSVRLEPTRGDKAKGDIGLLDANYHAHAQKLLPKATSYSTGVLNYFFRGKLEVRIVPHPTARGFYYLFIENVSGDGETLIGGSEDWVLLRHDGLSRTDVRADFGRFGSAHGGRLAHGQEFQALFSSPADKPFIFTLVFKGTIGNEKDIAIAAKVIPEPSTLALLGTGSLGLLGYGWRRRGRAA